MTCGKSWNPFGPRQSDKHRLDPNALSSLKTALKIGLVSLRRSALQTMAQKTHRFLRRRCVLSVR
ncbi:hypothetical protein V7x_37730 [Crateriforma conspicua]|uniref:Uncharacterized protein n=1 Tax=Crateriforma conspicua TaxID=2527996 RepID=A0A5C6FL53_9PLAN|nr:hypothetical protein V7x_37730 [Crateriforma conspicua]